MQIRHQTFVGTMPPLQADGHSLEVLHYRHRDGRSHLFFVDPDKPCKLQAKSESRDVTKLGYRRYGNELILLGISAEKRLRGSGIGKTLIDYFRNSSTEAGLEFTSTGMVYKPLIALALRRAGLVATDEEVLAEILPRSASDISNRSVVPKVHIVKNNPGLELKDRSPHGKFYEVVAPDVVEASYPINSPEMTVPIHTTYRVPRAA